MKFFTFFFSLVIVLIFTVSCSAQSALQWATYCGATGDDYGAAVVTDASGNVYLAGSTSSTAGITSGGFQNSFGGGTQDAFLVKFNSAGIRQWATFYGGTGDDNGTAVAVDAVGNVYLAGTTTSTTGIASGGFHNTCQGFRDAFLVKFNSAGIRLWATYYGGPGTDFGQGVATDPISGDVYLTGDTYSSSGIASGGFQNSFGGTDDAFLVKFNSAGIRQWATFYGGTEIDFGQGVAIDASSGDVYLTGYTESAVGIASGGFQNTWGGGSFNGDAFLVKFNSTGIRQWATYYGVGWTLAWGIATGPAGSGVVYISGETDNTTGIATGGFQNTIAGGSDAFLAKFNSAGIRLWATYYGGNGSAPGYGNEESVHCAVDASGNVYISGDTYSDNGIASAGFQNVFNPSEDVFLTKFDSNGILQCATYYGTGPGDNEYGSVAVDGTGNVYLSGGTPNTGMASAGFQNTYGGGGYDAFLVQFKTCNACVPPTLIASSDTTICTGQSATISVNASGGTPGYSYQWFPAASLNSSTISNPVSSLTATTTYTVMVTDNVSCTNRAVVTVVIDPVAATISGNTSICDGSGTTLTASGGATYLWNTGSSSPSVILNPTVSTLYTVTVTSANGCTSVKTLTVTVSSFPVATITGNDTICQNSITVLTASGGGNYFWNTNQTTASITVSPTTNTTYSVIVSVGNCEDSASYSVTVLPKPTANAGMNVSIIQGQITTLTASGGATYFWNNGMTIQSIIVHPDITTIYCVTVTDINGCSDSTCITVNVEIECGELFIPTAFSPNADNNNDCFRIYGTIGCFKSFTLAIFDRWGEKVFSTNSPVECWNGTSNLLKAGKNKELNTGIFVYYLNVITIKDEEINKRGNISLIR